MKAMSSTCPRWSRMASSAWGGSTGCSTSWIPYGRTTGKHYSTCTVRHSHHGDVKTVPRHVWVDVLGAFVCFWYYFVWQTDFLSVCLIAWLSTWLPACLSVCLSLHSMEKDGSRLSDEKQTVQISLFSLLRDFLLRSPSPEELHSVLAYTLAVGEEQQVRNPGLPLSFSPGSVSCSPHTFTVSFRSVHQLHWYMVVASWSRQI